MARCLLRHLPAMSCRLRCSFALPLAGVDRRGTSSHQVRDIHESRASTYGRPPYDLFGGTTPGDEDFRRAWKENMDEDDCLWTGSDDDDGEEDDGKTKPKSTPKTRLEREIKKLKRQARANSDLIDADDSDELHSIMPESDDEMVLWSGSSDDDDDDVPTEAHPNERSDAYIDKLFEFEERPEFRSLAELLKSEEEKDQPPPELTPGKQARKLAVENALKKLRKGPDGRYTNVFEVMTDIDVLIGAFENVVAGPEYAELREGGPKKLNMQFFKDIQARMRDPGFRFTPELQLRPKSKMVSRKKWQRAQARRRRDLRR